MNDSRWILISVAAGLLTGGCQQQMARIFYQPQSPRAAVVAEYVALAADTGGNPATAPGIAASGPSTQPAAGAYYTAPASEIQRLTFLTMLGATSAAPGLGSAGKEASESSLAALGGTAMATGGLAGLGAPQPRTLTAVVGQPGLQRGFAAGLGFAKPNTIFTPRANPLTGPNGRCQELIRAGLFSNQTACLQYFGK